MKKNILILCALEKEIQVAKKLLWSYKNKNINIDFFVHGIWNINTSIYLTKKLSQTRYDFVLNYGVCWHRDSPRDLIQVIRSFYLPGKKEVCVPVFIQYAPLSGILCSEEPISQKQDMQSELYVDMESYAIEKVCESFKIPRLILKVPVDNVWEETLSFNSEHACKLLEKNIDFHDLILRIETYLWSLPKKPDTEKYEVLFAFTVSEKVILQKYIQKFLMLSSENIEDFVWEHAQGDKKTFLKSLENHIYNLWKL